MVEYELCDASIDTIIDFCHDLLGDEKLVVYGYGTEHDLVLHIYKDEDYHPYMDEDKYDIVTIHTAQNGVWVDDTEDIYVTDGSLSRELERLMYYRDFGLL